MSESEKYQEEAPDHSYRTETPNIIFKMGLSNSEIAVYLAIKRIAGDYGNCYCKRENLAKEANVSVRFLQMTVKKLLKIHPLIKKPLLKLFRRKNDDGSSNTNLYLIVDIWRENGDFFKSLHKNKKTKPKKYPDEEVFEEETPEEEGATIAPYPEEGRVQPLHPPGAMVAPKQDLFEEEVVLSCATQCEAIEKQAKLDHPDGHSYLINIDEIYTYAVRTQQNWRGEEIEAAWKVLLNYEKPIRDAIAFVTGTINILRNNATLDKIRKYKSKEKPCNQKKATTNESIQRRETEQKAKPRPINFPKNL